MENKYQCFRVYESYEMKELLPDDLRLRYYDALLAYGLREEQPQFEEPLLKVAWKGIVPHLIKSHQRQITGKDNGKNGGAPKGNQNARKTTEKQTNVNVNDNVNVNVSGGSDQRDRERIFERFFFKNFKDPAGEMERYWDNYAGQGWKTSKGAAIEDKVAYCSNWRPLDERPRFNTDVIKAFESLYYKAAGGGENSHRLLAGLLTVSRGDDGGLVLDYNDREAAQAMANQLDKRGLKADAQVRIVKNNQKTTYG